MGEVVNINLEEYYEEGKGYPTSLITENNGRITIKIMLYISITNIAVICVISFDLHSSFIKLDIIAPFYKLRSLNM